jgi:hypothetical protein
VAVNNESRDGGQQRFVDAFAKVMHANGGGRRKGVIVVAAGIVAISTGVPVGIGAIGAHKHAGASARLRPVALTQQSLVKKIARRSGTPSSSYLSPGGSSVPPGDDWQVPGGDTPAQQAAQPAPGPAPSASSVGRSRVAAKASVKTASTTPPPATRSASAQENQPLTAAPVQSSTSAPVQSSGSYEITGQVTCMSGNSVEGVWVQAAEGKGWASWMKLGNGSTSDWWLKLPENESYTLAVGCGGSPENWAVTAHTPWVNGGHNSFNCFDVPGGQDYGQCEWRE